VAVSSERGKECILINRGRSWGSWGVCLCECPVCVFVGVCVRVCVFVVVCVSVFVCVSV
jgi:hypothetical protein